MGNNLFSEFEGKAPGRRTAWSAAKIAARKTHHAALGEASPGVPHSGSDMILSVYVANVLSLEREALAKGTAPPELDMELLEQNDRVTTLPEWRKIAETADSKQAELAN
jgi:hypothetical protein